MEPCQQVPPQGLTPAAAGGLLYALWLDLMTYAGV